MSEKQDRPSTSHAVLARVLGDKAATSACVGFILFVISVTFAHGDELPRFLTEVVSGIAFLIALVLEKRIYVRAIFALFLVGTLFLIMIDFNISEQLSQSRSDQVFEPPQD